MKIISIGNFKGGVGKTTSTANIGFGLAELGKRVLLVDLDAQHNLTQSCGINDTAELQTSYNVLVKKQLIKPYYIMERLAILPSSLDLIKAEIELSAEFQREYILNKALIPISNDFDFCLIDCPPSLGLLTLNAFVSSDLIFVPIEAEFLSLKGFSILSESLQGIGLSIDKVFITKYDSRKILNRNVLETLKESLGNVVFNTIIRTNVALAECPSKGQSVFQYAPNSTGANDYINLATEILTKYS